MAYNVFSGTLNPTQSINQSVVRSDIRDATSSANLHLIQYACLWDFTDCGFGIIWYKCLQNLQTFKH